MGSSSLKWPVTCRLLFALFLASCASNPSAVRLATPSATPGEQYCYQAHNERIAELDARLEKALEDDPLEWHASIKSKLDPDALAQFAQESEALLRSRNALLKA